MSLSLGLFLPGWFLLLGCVILIYDSNNNKRWDLTSYFVIEVLLLIVTGLAVSAIVLGEKQDEDVSGNLGSTLITGGIILLLGASIIFLYILTHRKVTQVFELRASLQVQRERNRTEDSLREAAGIAALQSAAEREAREAQREKEEELVGSHVGSSARPPFHNSNSSPIRGATQGGATLPDEHKNSPSLQA